jgi:hypothetical protein
MSDYKSTRLKKNAEIMNAMANIRKDLYEWKAPTNLYKINSNSSGMTTNSSAQRLQSLDSSNSASTFKRTNSLSSINSGRSVNSGKLKNQSSILNSNRLRPLSSNKSKKSLTDDFSDKDMLDLDENLDQTQDNEFLKTFKSNKKSSNNERLYLNSARAPIQSARRTYEEIENELVIIFLFLSKS